MTITISILGSTGSIGLNTLKIIDKKKNKFKVNLLAANSNYSKICYQIKKYNPKFFFINDIIIFKKLKNKYRKKKVKIINNFNDIKLKKIDITISAIPGLAGLKSTLFAIKSSKKVLVANKESVICGWNLIKDHAKKYRTKIVPVDSEHYSIFKLLENHNLDEIRKIYITASGGPFLNYKKKQMLKISPNQALNHPKWKMGKKISIDSSTLMNKILELIEAQKLFNIPKNKLDILIHPESLVHAVIMLKNGLVKFIYHNTSMIIPLANAIFDGKLEINDFLSINKNKKKIHNLSFDNVNNKIFPIIKLKNRVNEHPSTSIIVNAANEILVDQFLQKKIPFLAISKIIKTILNDRNYKKYAIKHPKNINQINKVDFWARKTTMSKI